MVSRKRCRARWGWAGALLVVSACGSSSSGDEKDDGTTGGAATSVGGSTASAGGSGTASRDGSGPQGSAGGSRGGGETGGAASSGATPSSGGWLEGPSGVGGSAGSDSALPPAPIVGGAGGTSFATGGAGAATSGTAGATGTQAGAGGGGSGSIESGGANPVDEDAGGSGRASGGAMTSTGGAESQSGGASNGGTPGPGDGGVEGVAGASGQGTVRCTGATTLAAAGECTGRLIGVAVDATHLTEAEYAERVGEFNYVTPENEMKWANTEPSPGAFDFHSADQIVDFARARGMRVKGHTLVWYNQLPGWVESLTDPASVRSAMQNHIEGVMGHYRGEIHAWDVVNEAWNDDGATLRDCPFHRHIGAEYIDEAFRYARQVDADAKLFYNDYDAEDMGAKSDAVYDMVAGMRERGVPIDGVGLQMHLRIPDTEPSIADLEANIARLTALGLEVHLSEVDIRLCNGETEAMQSERWHDVVEVCMQEPLCTAITTWGITDKYSWVNTPGPPDCPNGETPHPLLWDDAYGRKPAYDGFMAALLGE